MQFPVDHPIFLFKYKLKASISFLFDTNTQRTAIVSYSGSSHGTFDYCKKKRYSTNIKNSKYLCKQLKVYIKILVFVIHVKKNYSTHDLWPLFIILTPRALKVN